MAHQIRLADALDVKDVFKIQENSFINAPWTRGDILRAIKQKKIHVYDCHSDIVSYIWVEVDKKNNIAYIDSLATDERFRRKGYGELLLNHVLTKLEASGTKAFQLHVFVLNREAIDLYKKYGFQKIDCIVDHYGPADSNKNSAYLMERNLDVEYKQI